MLKFAYYPTSGEPHFITLDHQPDLQVLQSLVGGYLEVLTPGVDGLVFYGCEDAIARYYPINPYVPMYVGSLIAFGGFDQNGDMLSVPEGHNLKSPLG